MAQQGVHARFATTELYKEFQRIARSARLEDGGHEFPAGAGIEDAALLKLRIGVGVQDLGPF